MRLLMEDSRSDRGFKVTRRGGWYSRGAAYSITRMRADKRKSRQNQDSWRQSGKLFRQRGRIIHETFSSRVSLCSTKPR